MSKWTKIRGMFSDNEVLSGDDFYISYNPDTSFGGLWFFAGADCDETALCSRAKGRAPFLILTGDFRKQYEEAVPLGYDACLAIYDAHKAEFSSPWSDDKEEAV